MIDLQDVLETHRYVIHRYGGSHGLRDKALLLSALDRPFGGFGDAAFYPSIEEKSAALVESLIKNHPFMDGNKRAGYFMMDSLLMRDGKTIEASEDEIYDFVVRIASGQMSYDDILQWMRERVVSL